MVKMGFVEDHHYTQAHHTDLTHLNWGQASHKGEQASQEETKGNGDTKKNRKKKKKAKNKKGGTTFK